MCIRDRNKGKHLIPGDVQHEPEFVIQLIFCRLEQLLVAHGQQLAGGHLLFVGVHILHQMHQGTGVSAAQGLSADLTALPAVADPAGGIDQLPGQQLKDFPG